jgi:hypothetical protein
VSLQRWNRFRHTIIATMVIMALGNGALGYYVLEHGTEQRRLLRENCVDSRGDASYRTFLRELNRITNDTKLTRDQARTQTIQAIDHALANAGPAPPCPPGS